MAEHETLSESIEHPVDNGGHDVHGGPLQDPAFWVGIAFVMFVGLLIWKKVPKLITDALDKRADGIRTQLEEARALREEAQALLAEYQRKQRDAEQEAEKIVERAREEAERISADAKAALEASIERRTQLAQDKIAQAEAAAVKEVQAVAVDVATSTARKLIQEEMSQDKADALTEQVIKELPGHLN